jgi:predicted metal-dependent phosphoesterase TrpH
MKAIQAEVGQDPGAAQIKKDAVEEEWPRVCRRFNDDVERVCDVSGIGEYTGLYRCFDDHNQAVYYLVSEDTALYRMRRKHFLDNIGYKSGEKSE